MDCRGKSGFGRLPGELLQRVYTQPVLCVEDRLRALAVCKWWGSSLAGLPFASLAIVHECRQEASLRPQKQLLWSLATQPAIVDLKLDIHGHHVSAELATQALHSIDRQALRKLSCSVERGMCLPCPAIFPGLQSLSVGHRSVGPVWVRQLPRLKHLTHLSLVVSPREASKGVFPFPAVPSLRELSLRLCENGSLVAPWGDMPALRRLEVTSHLDGSSLDLSDCGAGLSQLEELCLDLKGWAEVDFALLPALKAASLWCGALEGAATVQQAASLTRLHFETEMPYIRLGQPWMVELLQCAPPSLRQLGLSGKWTRELADTVSGLQQLDSLSVESGEATLELPAEPLWQQLKELCWKCDVPLPLALRGAPQLHTLFLCLDRLEDLHMLASLPALKHLRLMEDGCSAQGEERRRWQQSACLQLVPRVLPNLESLKSVDWDSLCELGGSGVQD